jgi:hypothetical protein
MLAPFAVDCVKRAVHGHYFLDLNAEYGLDGDGWPLDDSGHNN